MRHLKSLKKAHGEGVIDVHPDDVIVINEIRKGEPRAEAKKRDPKDRSTRDIPPCTVVGFRNGRSVPVAHTRAEVLEILSGAAEGPPNEE